MTTTLSPAAPAALTPEVVGKALYLELKPALDEEGKPVSYRAYGSDVVQQIIIFPAGQTPEGHEVLPILMDRTLSKHYPRSQWSQTRIQPTPSKSEFATRGEEKYRSINLQEVPTDSEAKALPEEIRSALYTNGIEAALFSRIVDERSVYDPEAGNYTSTWIQGWKIERKFAVEVTDKDLSELRSYKTPQAVIRRIGKTRVALGLPEKLV